MSRDSNRIALRNAIVAEAFSWLGTPYHPHAHVKGVGTDCVWLLVCVFQAVGKVAQDFDPGNYAPEWYFHQSEEIYLQGVLKHARQVEVPELGDVAVYNFGRCVSHGVIIVQVPDAHGHGELMGIHAHRPSRNVELIELRSLEDRFHSYWSAV
jgi:cell wall-associated NlpC family hydrolase